MENIELNESTDNGFMSPNMDFIDAFILDTIDGNEKENLVTRQYDWMQYINKFQGECIHVVYRCLYDKDGSVKHLISIFWISDMCTGQVCEGFENETDLQTIRQPGEEGTRCQYMNCSLVNVDDLSGFFSQWRSVLSEIRIYKKVLKQSE